MTPDINDLIAHEAPMILIDRVIDHTEEWIETEVFITEDTPFLKGGQVPSYVVIEYMAQSIAALSGLKAHAKQEEIKIGFLLGTRKLSLQRDHFAIGDVIRVEAKSLYDDGSMGSLDCLAKIAGDVIAEARLNVYQPNEEEMEKEGSQ
ncbi:hypothetical protein [Terasakiella pusilla]|uniref:ApeP family dehydratase n=1 Tax=Terasakiella pusilla TaxID=64973 RepID=UPI003AA9A3C2